MAAHLNTGGITTYLLTLVREQKKAGHEVYVWASSGSRLAVFKECCDGVLCDVPRCKSELSPRLWVQLPRFISFLKSHAIDIIHTHTRVGQVLTAAATFFLKIPYVSTAHMFYKRRLGRRLFPCWGRAVIAISKTMQKGLTDIFGEKNLPQVLIVTNGIDVQALHDRLDRTDRQAARKIYGYDEKNLVVLALARLVPVKGIHILIDALAVALRQAPSLRLLIAGSGDENYIRQLENQVLQLHLQDFVLFIGNEPSIEKPFKAADIYVAPFMWPEAFGLSILEAMAAGLPVIGSNSGGISELLGCGTCGLLFEEANVKELADCLLKYAKDPALRARMGMVASRVSLEYSSEKMFQQIQKIYENIVTAKT